MADRLLKPAAAARRLLSRVMKITQDQGEKSGTGTKVRKKPAVRQTAPQRLPQKKNLSTATSIFENNFSVLALQQHCTKIDTLAPPRVFGHRGFRLDSTPALHVAPGCPQRTFNTGCTHAQERSADSLVQGAEILHRPLLYSLRSESPWSARQSISPHKDRVRADGMGACASRKPNVRPRTAGCSPPQHAASPIAVTVPMSNSFVALAGRYHQPVFDFHVHSAVRASAEMSRTP